MCSMYKKNYAYEISKKGENMKLKLFFLIPLIMIFHFSLLTAQETIIDTVYSIPYLDGTIAHSPGLGYFGIGANSVFGIAGDYYSNILWDYFFNRSFFAFELPIIPEGYLLTSSYIYIYQFTSEGNGIVGNYPIFDMSSGTFEPPCLIEHIDYGYTLDETDFFLPSLNCIGIISNTPEVGWRTIEVTEFVLDDIENTRPFTQYRLRLAIDMDEDQYVDALFFKTSDTSMNLEPYIIYIIEENTNISNEQFPRNQVYLSNYPNPFNPQTIISYEILLNAENPVIEIYNIKGQKIKTFPIPNSSLQISNQVVWDGRDNNGKEVTSGLYLCRLRVGKQMFTRKMLMMK